MGSSEAGSREKGYTRPAWRLILAIGLIALVTTGVTYIRPVRETISGVVSEVRSSC